MFKKELGVIALVVCLFALFCTPCYASDDATPETTTVVEEDEGSTDGIAALAAALAMGLCALATGLAQSRIGAAGCGAIAEKPETVGTVILLVAIPETMAILGFVIAIVIMFAR